MRDGSNASSKNTAPSEAGSDIPVNNSNSNSMSRPVKCYRCLDMGHVRRFCSSKVRCSLCFTLGHIRRRCPSRHRPKPIWVWKPKSLMLKTSKQEGLKTVSRSHLMWRPKVAFQSQSDPPRKKSIGCDRSLDSRALKADSSASRILEQQQQTENLPHTSPPSNPDISVAPNNQQDRTRFIAAQSHCANIALFHRRGTPSGALPGAQPIAIRPILVDREVRAPAPQAQAVTGREIVPWRPIPHVIALQLWPDIVEARRRAVRQKLATEVNVIQLSDAEQGPMLSGLVAFEFQTESNRPSPPSARGQKNRRPSQKRTIALPSTTSSSNPSSPMVQDSLRRSFRISANKEGYWNVRVDKEPSKKRKISAVMIDEATGQASPIPLAVL